MKACPLGLMVVAACLLCLPVAAQSAPPSADTFVNSSAPSTNFGSSFVDVVGAGSTTYIKFNLSDVPAGQPVSKATLRLYVDAVASGGKFDVYNLPSSPTWSENTLKYNTPPPVLGTSATGGHPITITGASVNTFLLIDITATVQGWLTNPATNNGIALALVGSSGLFSFDSKESDFTSHQPEVEIVLAGQPGAQGPQGQQGPQGLTGAAGATGAKGDAGPQGTQGVKGDTGATGPIGPLGPVGPQGPQGNTGAQGLIGPPGTNGANGTNGVDGKGFNFRGPFVPGTAYSQYDVVTYNGSTYDATGAINPGDAAPGINPQWVLMAEVGAPGTTGPKGDTGATGAVGPQGAQGVKGDIGATGAVGAQGVKGDTGATGAVGPQGAQGLKGDTGVTGAIGPQGPQGNTGPAGADGTNGVNGKSLNFTGTFNPSLPYNQYDVVTFNGSTYEANVATISPGAGNPDTNPQWALLAQVGATGPQGPQGVKGDTGVQGPQGLTGNTGATGSQGPKGDKGDTGATGAVGPQGNTGATGAQGPQGLKGDIGATGAVGPQGNTGATGSKGDKGDTGPQGVKGDTGDANARMIFPSFFPGNLTGTWVGGKLILDQPITILRIAASAKTPTAANCPAAVFRFTDGAKGQDLVLAPGQYWSDSGPITLTFAAGTTLQASLRTGSTCASNTGADANLLVEYKMQAAGDTDACTGTLCNGICTTTSADPANCGSCGNACASGTPCSGGNCTSGAPQCTSNADCTGGLVCVGGTCQACTSGSQCSAGQVCTSGVCVTPTQPNGAACNNASQCSSTFCVAGVCCQNSCSIQNGSPSCTGGTCAVASCNSGFADCNSSAIDGCEVNTRTDLNNCGGCGIKCSTGQTCTGGTCVAAAPTCFDGIKNGNETDVDCGGGTCGKCANGKTCVVNNDCNSGNCTGGTCH
jgi:hypothetical protein